jgi:hypothetical protein
MKVYHYTTNIALSKIVMDGKLITTSVLICKNERPAVWFSTNPDWDETVRKSFINKMTGEKTPPLSRDDIYKNGFIPVRIEVEQTLPFINWKKFKRRSGISKTIAKSLEDVAKKWGANPKEWLALFSPVSSDHFLNIQVWDGHNWQVYWEKEIENL